MMKKKLSWLVLLMALMMVLAACGGKKAPKNVSKEDLEQLLPNVRSALEASEQAADGDAQKPAPNECSVSISVQNVKKNMNLLPPAKHKLIPESGMLLEKTTVPLQGGESAYDVLQRVTKEQKIHLDSSFSPAFNSDYIKGMGNLYEFDCGGYSGWLYQVNGEMPTVGYGQYKVQPGDVVEFYYSCEE